MGETDFLVGAQIRGLKVGWKKGKYTGASLFGLNRGDVCHSVMNGSLDPLRLDVGHCGFNGFQSREGRTCQGQCSCGKTLHEQN